MQNLQRQVLGEDVGKRFFSKNREGKVKCLIQRMRKAPRTSIELDCTNHTNPIITYSTDNPCMICMILGY